MKEFTKSTECKRYNRLKAAAEKKSRISAAKRRFLGSKTAPKKPQRPMSTYRLFCNAKRPTITADGKKDMHMTLTKMWQEATAEDKGGFRKSK